MSANTLASGKKTLNTKYWICSLIGIWFLFGFGLLPPFAELTVVGMKILGIFIGVIFLWSTVDVVWPSILGIVAYGLSGYSSMNAVISESMGSSVIWQIIMIMCIAGALTTSGVGEYIARWLISRPFVNGKPVLFTVVYLLGFMIAAMISNCFASIFLSWAVLASMAKMLGMQKGDKWITLMNIFTAVASGLGDFVIPFKGWQLAICNAFGSATGTPVSYPVYCAFSLCLGTAVTVLLGLSVKYIFRADMSKLVSFDATTLRDTKTTRLNVRQKSYLFIFLLIITSTLATTVMPKDWLLVKALSALTTAGVFAVAVVVLCLVKLPDGKPLMDFKVCSTAGIKWEAIFMVASIIPIATALTSDKTGILPLCTRILNPIFEGKSVAFVLIVLVVVDLILTNLGSNTGIAMFLIPIALPIAQQAGMSMNLLAIVVIYTACMGFVLPGSSAIGAITYANEWLKPVSIMKYAGFAVALYAVVAIPVFLIAGMVL